MFLLLLIPLFIYLLYRYTTPKRPPNFPPGPTNYPLAGGAWIFQQHGPDFSQAVIKIGEKYGPVTGLHLGQLPSIIVTGYDAVKEVLSREEFQGRPEIFLNNLIYGKGRKMGIMFSDGLKWQNQRRFTLRHLRDFGFGKSSMETVVHEEIGGLLNTLRNKCRANNVIKMNDVFGPAVINVMWVIMSGKRQSHDDPGFRRLLDLLYKVFRSGNIGGNLMQDWPWLRFIPPFAKQYKAMRNGRDALSHMLKEEIHAHLTTLDPTEPRDFIDLYLKEIDASKIAGNIDSDFTNEQLGAVCSDLFAAGAESTSNSIAFGILYMLLYPDVQKKVQMELDEVVGKARLPSYAVDRRSLQYTEAVLSELLRISSIAPLTVPHSTVEDTVLHGFDIPKNTFTLISLGSVHMDKSYWGDPEVFRPSRFLNDEGNLIKTDHLMGFGYGKRACLGEVLARMNTFNFFTAILQNFKIELPPGLEKPSTIPVQGFTVAPQEFYVKLMAR